MSIILVIFLIFLSLHSCNARVFKVDHSTHHAKELPINKENDEKLVKHDLSEAEEKLQTVGNRVNAEMGKKEINVVIKESSSASKKISFKVHQKKGGDEDKELFIDYTPPRTHPPSHN